MFLGHCLSLVQELPGLLVEDPLGDVFNTPTREEISRKYHKVSKVIHAHLMLTLEDKNSKSTYLDSFLKVSGL